uniref:Uncharacterized protein n=1 Tax=Anguilla anguilla TaxID=7936 RepID=A0A0E9PF00_ANGAN
MVAPCGNCWNTSTPLASCGNCWNTV